MLTAAAELSERKPNFRNLIISFISRVLTDEEPGRDRQSVLMKFELLLLLDRLSCA